MDISIVVPVYNEEQSIEPLLAGISAVAPSLGSYEVIFVDDGSRDTTWERISQLSTAAPHIVKGIKLRRNFGKSAALMAGFHQAQGQIIFTMDGDLQDDPAEMPRFLQKLNSGYDLVSGWKRIRRDPLDKTLPSRIFNAMISGLTGVKLHDFNCGYKAYRRAVVENLSLYGELYRFIPVFAHADGFVVGEIDVNHHPRKYGKSKFGIERFAKGFIDLLSVAAMTKFGRRPGHLFGGLGVIFGIIGFLSLLTLFIHHLMHLPIVTRPLFFFGILSMMLSAQLICTGVIAELFLRQSSGQGSPQQPPIAARVGQLQ